MSAPPTDLHEPADFEAPGLVRPARRLRRGLGLLLAAAVLLGIGLLYLVGRPADQARMPRDLMEEATTRHLVGQRVTSGPLTVVVLEAGRVTDSTWGVHFVAFADGLSPREALSVSVPVGTTGFPSVGVEPVGAPFQVGGDLVESGFGPGTHVVEAWVLIPAGTAEIPMTFAAGVPEVPGPRSVPPAPSQGQPDLQQGSEPLFMPPTVPGTARTLGTVSVRVEDLRLPPAIWAD